MIDRSIKSLKLNGFFLLGPRVVGKTTLLESLCLGEPIILIKLLDPEIESESLRSPSLLRERVEQTKPKRVIIDEVQKVPQILNVVNMLIEKYKQIQFIMTGSSARKLKRGAANPKGINGKEVGVKNLP